MFYERKIKYLDYIEYGERVKNAGFVKIEVRDKECNLEIQVKGVPIREMVVRELHLHGNGKTSSLGEITLLNGEGVFTVHKAQSGALGDGGLQYVDLEQIRITIDHNRYIQCVWASGKAPSTVESGVEGSITVPQKYATAVGKDSTEASSAVLQKPVTVESEDIPGAIKVESTKGEASAQDGIARPNDASMSQSTARQEMQASNPTPTETVTSSSQSSIGQPTIGQPTMRSHTPWQELKFPWMRGKVQLHMDENIEGAEIKAREDESKEHPTCPKCVTAKEMTSGKQGNHSNSGINAEDKWSQLASLYPHICPFEDEREYLLLKPADFVILGSHSYPLVNNSFLLHGFYNYNHLILVRKTNRGEDTYYLGVPGNFYDREKQVAIMFGFESFECKEEPAGHGDFGYYMIRVDV